MKGRIIYEPRNSGVYLLDSIDDSQEITGLGNTSVTLTNGNEIIETTTNASGSFSFTDLRPGTWSLHVSDGQIPKYHEIVPDLLVLEFGSGTQMDDIFLVVAKTKRPIIITAKDTN